MDKRGQRTFWAAHADRDASFLDPATERFASKMLAAFPALREDRNPASVIASAPGSVPARTGGATHSAAADFLAVFSLADLDGSNGFAILGIEEFDGIGGSVSSAGDVNGDGFDDIIIGASGKSYVVFGKAGGFAASLDLSTLDGSNGFRLDGIDSGRSVSSAGDVNGDGFDDVIIGAPGNYSDAGKTYVVFGKAGGFAASLDLAALDGTNGFRLDGVDARGNSGYSVSSAGDVNGDGFDDIIIGAYKADPGGDYNAGESYVVFGKADGFGASIELATLDGSSGFSIGGTDVGDYNGCSVSSAGDVNGDGFDDIIIGARGGDPRGVNLAGESYVVFGKAGGFAASLDLTTLNGTNGFRLDGVDRLDGSGRSVSSAGDVNGDGFDDIIIGAPLTDPDGDNTAGQSYVVFGKAGGFAASLDLSTLDGSNGFRIDGIDFVDQSGFSVSSAGDVNGDGFDDVIIGAAFADPGGDSSAGESYVVFGKAGGFAARVDLAALDGTNGFRIDGVDEGDWSGRSVSAAGDVNGDGFDDIIIGAPDAEPGGDIFAGASYVVFGQAPTEAVKRIGSEADQTIRGGDFDDVLRGKQGDDILIGGDGGGDLLRGGKGADTLDGGTGSDRMNGGDGHDSVTGGAGADNFRLASAAPEDSDDLLDFMSGEDRIELVGDVFGLGAGALDPASFVIGNTAGDADDRLIYDDATGNLFFDADGAGGSAQVLIATLIGAPPLMAGDILVI